MWWIGLSLLFMYVHLKHRLKRRPWISFCLSKDRALEMQVVVNLAEWLRRETWNLMGSPAQVQILQLTLFSLIIFRSLFQLKLTKLILKLFPQLAIRLQSCHFSPEIWNLIIRSLFWETGGFWCWSMKC